LKKRVTDEDVAKAIGDMAEQIRSEMDYEFRVAMSQMWIAEKDFIETLNEEQMKLYSEFEKKREEFYDIAKELYQRKF
jgi:hypothetical protein